MSLKLLVFGDLLNLDRACLRCLIASLQSSLYHGFLLVGFVEVCGIHSLNISISEEVKSDIGSEDSLKFSGINLPVHRVLNRSHWLYLVSTLDCGPQWKKCSVQ